MKSKEMKFAVNLAEKAGEIIKENFGLVQKTAWKKDKTPVTKTDKSINDLVIGSLKKQFPGHSLLAEEESFFVKNSEYAWVCDPLDGTLAFSRGIPIATFILSLLKNGKSILGVVYEPYLDWMFTAEKGEGAFVNNKEISVSLTKDFKKSVVGFSTRKGHKINLLEVFKIFNRQGIRILGLGSAGYMGTLVACGKLDAYISSIRNPYEAAALKIIVEEAGGRVTDIFGKEQRYDKKIKGFLITNNLLHEKLAKLTKIKVKANNL